MIPSLRSLANLWIILALLSGGISTYIWMNSEAKWDAYLHRAFMAGISLHDFMQGHNLLADGLVATPLSGDLNRLADANFLRKLPEVSSSDHITRFILDDTTSGDGEQQTFRVTILSHDLIYDKTKIALNQPVTNAQKLGEITRLIANYCSHNTLLVKYANETWMRVTGEDIWGCKSQPTDLRLLAIALVIISLISLFAFIAQTTSHLSALQQMLSQRHHSRAGNMYQAAGPAEVRELAKALNSHIAQERASLEKRAMFLSGVSHDLGTPATRLLLRSELIADDTLRHKVEADIMQMTDMIESVLAYTQAEMNAEAPRRLSLTSLLQAIIDDYIDIDKPVQFVTVEKPTEMVRSIFLGRQKKPAQSESNKLESMVIYGQPLSLQRAITNLIENALKYGRRATVSVQADDKIAQIFVDDDGNDMSVDGLAALTKPFKRGKNAANTQGKGIGLAITATIAEQHGGHLDFEETSTGLRAILTLARQK